MPNIPGNLDFSTFLYMFNWDLHKIINERIHYEHFLWREKKGSWLEVKFWSLYPSLENTWDFSLPTCRTLKRAHLCPQNSKRLNHQRPWLWVRCWAPGGGWKIVGSVLATPWDWGQCVLGPSALPSSLLPQRFTPVYIGETATSVSSRLKEV